MGIEWLRPAAFFGSIVYALIGVLIFRPSGLIGERVAERA